MLVMYTGSLWFPGGIPAANYRDGVSGALPDPYGAISGTVQGPSALVQLT